uniref:amidohydrolase family protein n=1 Tax=Paenibacillus abyssi TaxID=1340531 RepID=UPI00366E24CB
MPRVERVNGTDRWFVGDRDFGTLGGNVIRADNNKLLGRLAFPKLEQAHPGGHELKARLQAMDDMGVYAQICFQNSGVTQAGSLMSLGDPELALKIVQIYNDASAEFQEASGQRIFNMAHLPFWDQKALEAEAKRCHEIGLRGLCCPTRPSASACQLQPRVLDPVPGDVRRHRAAAELHLNAAIDPNTLTWEGFKFEQTLSVVATMFSIGNAATLGNWMVSGRLDRHPGLKIGLIESGAGWVPFAVEALEHQFREMLPIMRDVLKKQPWDYFRDHFFCTFWFEKIAPKYLLEIIASTTSCSRPISRTRPRSIRACRSTSRTCSAATARRAQEGPPGQRGAALQPAVLTLARPGCGRDDACASRAIEQRERGHVVHPRAPAGLVDGLLRYPSSMVEAPARPARRPRRSVAGRSRRARPSRCR